MTVAVLVFIASLAGGAGAFAWKKILISSQASYEEQLKIRRQQFNIDLIEQLKQANVKIDTARNLMASHLATSQVFDILSRMTIQNVRYVDLDLSGPTLPGEPVTLSLKGVGTTFSALAFQSQVLSELEQFGLRRVVKNPILSNPTQSSAGGVSFSLTATIDPVNLSYERSVTTMSSDSLPPADDAAGSSIQ